MENIVDTSAKPVSPFRNPAITWARVIRRGMIVWLLIAFYLMPNSLSRLSRAEQHLQYPQSKCSGRSNRAWHDIRDDRWRL
jgi:hypothetical protein